MAPHWTARLEYLLTDYGTSGVTFPGTGQRFVSDFFQQELRAGVNYRFGDEAAPAIEMDGGIGAAGGPGQLSWPGHVRLAGLSGYPLALCRNQQPAR